MISITLEPPRANGQARFVITEDDLTVVWACSDQIPIGVAVRNMLEAFINQSSREKAKAWLKT